MARSVVSQPSLCAAVSVYLAALSLGCGGGGSNTPMLSVGGTYQTQVTLLPGNTCSGVTVQDNPTIVTQNPGAPTLLIRHASINTTGNIDSTAHFATYPTPVSTFTVTITGQFSLTGLDATVTLTQAQPPANTWSIGSEQKTVLRTRSHLDLHLIV